MAKLYYSISEVAEIIGETVVTVRFWTQKFPRFVAPARNAKENRMYRQSDLENLKIIKRLTRDEGLSLDAVKRKLSRRDDGSDKSLKIQEALLQIRERLEQIRNSL